MRLKEEILKKRPQMKKSKVLFHQDIAPCHKLITTMAKLHWIALWITSAPTLFSRFEEVISETEAYFEAKDKSLYKKGIELLE